MIFFERTSSSYGGLTLDDVREGIAAVFSAIGGSRNMLIVPPDITRIHSRAGDITRCIYEQARGAVRAILPALGTHLPMTDEELHTMFGDLPVSLFRAHRWRVDCEQVGVVDAEFVEAVSEGAVKYEIPVSVNRMLFDSAIDWIFSISQVVPHEVAGMSGYSKNIIVGLGGAENIHKTHFLGAAYGMERIMGQVDSPVRKVLNHAMTKFLGKLPFVHAITVMDRTENGTLRMCGLFIGDDDECFTKASELSRTVNVHALGAPVAKAVVYLDPLEYRSTWLGNKSIYRTRMAIADGGELLVLAPGVRMFGEDPEIDRLIRVFGYRGTPATMAAIEKDSGLRGNLSAAAHLIHGSSEDRFSITYCTGGLDRSEVEGAGFRFAPVDAMLERYNPQKLQEGHNRLADGEKIYFIASPGSGLWAWREKFGG
jgi:nickel-dependent lactate racemase